MSCNISLRLLVCCFMHYFLFQVEQLPSNRAFRHPTGPTLKMEKAVGRERRGLVFSVHCPDIYSQKQQKLWTIAKREWLPLNKMYQKTQSYSTQAHAAFCGMF